MPFDVSKAAGDTTVSWTVTGPEAKVDPIVEAAIKYQWTHGYGPIVTDGAGIENLKPWNEATNQEKFDCANRRLRALFLDEANTQEVDDGVGAARAAAPKHDLDGTV
jgi:hypothetical protein